MPRGSKEKYTDKQKRKAEHIKEGYEERGVKSADAARIAWATVNKESGGGNKSGAGRGVKDNHDSIRKGGKIAGKKRAKKATKKAVKKACKKEIRRVKNKTQKSGKELAPLPFVGKTATPNKEDNHEAQQHRFIRIFAGR